MGGLFSRFNNKHFLSLLGNGISSVLGLLTWAVLYKSFPTPAEIGIYVFFFTILGSFETLRGGFLGTATVKFYAGTTGERGREVLGSVWFLAMVITGTVLLLNAGAYYLIPFTKNESAIIVIKWLGITLLSTLPFNVTYWKLQADEQYGKLSLLKWINSGSTLLVFAILAATKRMTLENALLYNFLTNCLTSIVALSFNFSGIKTVVHLSKAAIIEIAHYGKFNVLSAISSSLLGGVDIYIIAYLLGPAAVAVYNIPMRLMQIVELLIMSFGATAMSGMAVAFNQKNMHQVTYILKKYAGMLTIAIIPMTILAFFFADTATYLYVLGKHIYVGSEAANIFRLYMVIALLYPMDRFNGLTLDIINKPHINLYKVLILLAINIAGDFAGIAIFKDLYGIVAAAAITHLSGIIYGYYRLNKYMRVSVPEILRTGYTEMVLFIKQQLRLSPKG